MDNPKINALTTGTSRQQTSSNTSSRRPISNRSGLSSNGAARPAGGPSNLGVVRNATSLHEGDTIRGEISDLHNNEITVTLEDNTIVKGYVSDTSNLSIGQTGAFKLSSAQTGGILLDPVAKSITESEWTMINKALTEAGLPATEHNQAAVKALMDNLLPINKESIQHLMQQSYDFHTDDMNTLALMNRLMMKMDEETVTQFSNYRNGTDQLIEQLQNISNNLPKLLDALAHNGPADAVALFGEKLLDISLISSGSTSDNIARDNTIAILNASQKQELLNLLSNTGMTEDTLAKLEDGSLSIHDALTMIRDSAANGGITYTDTITSNVLYNKLMNINSILEPKGEMTAPVINENMTDAENADNIDNISETSDITDDVIEDILPESPEETVQNSIADNGHTARQITHFAANFLQNLAEAAKNSINNTLSSLQNNPTASPADIATDTVIDTLTDAYSKLGHEEDLLGTYLSPSERSELADKLMDAPVSKSMIDKIISGEAPTKDVLTVIKNIVSLSSSDKIQDLFQSDTFVKLFSKGLISNWSVTPDDLKNSGQIADFYKKLQSQMKGIESLIKNTLSGNDSENLSNSAHNIRSNIEFMKTLGETFSYLQIPLKMQRQNTHADLYVYTQKNKLKKHPEKARILLHLNMDNLGAIDVYIDKDTNNINTKFMLDNQSSIDLLNTNSDLLKDALNELGYTCQIKVENEDANASTVDEFINTKINTSATSDMKRFSFDIRA